MDVVSQRFEIGRNPTGAAQMAAWIHAQTQTNILATVTYHDFESLYCLVVMSTIFTVATTTPVGGQVAAATFSIRNDLTPMTNWLNSQVTGIANPTAPSLSTVVQGSLTGQGTLSVKLALVDSKGNTTAASPASQIAVPDGSELVIAAPAPDPAGIAVGYNVYIGTPGSETLQTATPVPFGGSYTGFGSGGFGSSGFGGHSAGSGYTQSTSLITGAASPTNNATAAKYLQHFSLSEQGDSQKLVTLIVSS